MNFSVLIPAYDAEAFIIEALDSVALQSRLPEQIVVIDDGSRDRTAALVEQWSATRGIAVDLFRQENMGPPAARNQGIKLSTCDWIAQLDADDLFQPDHLAVMERTIASWPKVVAAFGDGILFGTGTAESEPFSRKKAIAAAEHSCGDGVYILGGHLYRSLLSGNYIMPCCLVFNRVVALDIGLFDESMRYIEDRDFLLRLSRRGRFAFVDRVTARARVHESNITHPRNAVRNTQYALRVLQKALDHAAELDLCPEDIELTRAEMRRAMSLLLYAASTGGLQSYLKALHRLIGRPFVMSAVKPRDLLRAAYHTARNLRDRGRDL